ncbi:MAG TPA: dihydropteridine reductase [Firmicutes bacterium]|nr:dihydropteridine reductase [Bacillota bacterium]
MNMEQEKQFARQVRAEYAPGSEEEGKLEQLKKLDRAARRPAEIFAYTFGIVGALVLGVGMCLAMEVIGSMMPLGIVIGVVGIAMVTANYFLYRAILRSRKKKYAKEIVSLSDELLKNE